MKTSAPPRLHDGVPLPKVTDNQDEERGGWIERSAAFLTSMVVHVALLMTLALLSYPGYDPNRPLLEEEVIELHLPSPADDQGRPIAEDMYAEIESRATETMAALSVAPSIGKDGIANGQMLSQPVLNADLLAHDYTGAETTVDFPVSEVPEVPLLASGVPQGTLGDPRAIVRNYRQAFDRITEEILLMLEKKRVLVVWCFDQSESMQDDQDEIRARIDKVYEELALDKESGKGAVESPSPVMDKGFGGTCRANRPPTPPNCAKRSTPSKSTARAKRSCARRCCGRSKCMPAMRKRNDRQMVLILVTDESGERGDNLEYLEAAIAAARQNDCRVYVLGREAVFGYPYAHMSWTHPQTGKEHWLPVDRGPRRRFSSSCRPTASGNATTRIPAASGLTSRAGSRGKRAASFFCCPVWKQSSYKAPKATTTRLQCGITGPTCDRGVWRLPS